MSTFPICEGPYDLIVEEPGYVLCTACKAIVPIHRTQHVQANTIEELQEWEEAEYEQDLKQALHEAEQEIRGNDPVLKWMHGKAFFSVSQGRGRKRRRYSQEVVLIQFNGDHARGRWRSWSGEDRDDGGRLPWDEWATEVFGLHFCENLLIKGIQPDDYLRSKVEDLLKCRRRKF